jgi:hypothetical protein
MGEINPRFSIGYETGFGWVLRCDGRMIDRSVCEYDLLHIALDPRTLQQIDGGN